MVNTFINGSVFNFFLITEINQPEVSSSLISFFPKIFPKKYALMALRFSHIIVATNHHQNQNNAPDIKVMRVAGKSTNGRIV